MAGAAPRPGRPHRAAPTEFSPLLGAACGMRVSPMTDKKLSRYFFIALLLGTAVVFFRMLRIFFMPVLLAAVFATLFYPMYLRFLRAFRGRKTLASFFCCLALLLLLIAPLYLVADLVTHEAIDFYKSTQAHLGDISQQVQGPLGR